jgi:hypothetical protein
MLYTSDKLVSPFKTIFKEHYKALKTNSGQSQFTDHILEKKITPSNLWKM